MRKRRAKKLLVTAAVFAGLGASVYFAANSPAVQDSILRIAFKGRLACLVKFSPLMNRILIKDLLFENKETGFQVSAAGAEIRYSLFGFLRGKLVLTHVDVNNLELISKKQVLEKTGRISIKKLFLLQSVVIENGTIRNAAFKFANGNVFAADMLSLKFNQRLIGDMAVAINLQGTSFKGEDKSASIGNLSITGKTKIKDWSDAPPFVNSISGRLKFEDAVFNDFTITDLSANVNIQNGRFQLSDFQITKDERGIKGNFEADLPSETYKADIKIPEPILFPKLGEENPVINTSGMVSGEISLEGKGFAIKDASGTAKLDITHASEPLPPVVLKSSVSWKGGNISLEDTVVSVKEGTVKASGFINVPLRKFNIQFEGNNVPLEAVFGRFDDKNFHPILGLANANAHLEGWARDFRITGEAVTSAESGYYKIVTDRAHVRIDATYHEFNLAGEIEQAGKKTGDVILKIKYGPKTSVLPRPKNIHLEANVTDDDLGRSLKAYRLTGMGNGHLVLDGPIKSYTGKINASIDNGSFVDIAFQKVSAGATMSYKKIRFTDGEFVLPNIKPVPFSSPIQMDFNDRGFRLYGSPASGINFDADYESRDGTWRLRDVKFRDLALEGVYAPQGSSNLKIVGTIDGVDLTVFKKHLREMSGPVTVNLKMSGLSSSPSFDGSILFNGNMIYPRLMRQRLEQVVGRLDFSGHSIKSEAITGTIEDSGFVLRGGIKHANLEPQEFDLKLSADGLRYLFPGGTFWAEFNADVSLTGTKNSPLLKGDVNILEGRYTKDFVILEGFSIMKKDTVEDSSLFGDGSMRLDLNVTNTGDLAIKNNIGEIWLKTGVNIKGTVASKQVRGTIETVDGKIRYLGRDFTITKGFVEFRAPYTNPYLELNAEHDVPSIPDLVIYITLRGEVDNLRLDLSSTKALERRDIISLLLFGATEEEMKSAQLSSGLAPSIVASQVSHVVEQPITKLAHVDTFRLEAGGGIMSDASSSAHNAQISKIYLGKRLSDRMNFEFYTDVNSESTQQVVKAEYLLTDFLMLNAERSTGQNYKFNISLRFRER